MFLCKFVQNSPTGSEDADSKQCGRQKLDIQCAGVTKITKIKLTPCPILIMYANVIKITNWISTV